MKTRRIFIGTFINKDIFQDIYENIYEDFEGKVGGKWIEYQNLHFTYKFLGDVAESEIPIIKSIIRQALKSYTEPLTITGLSAFPNIRRPRVLFANVEAPQNLLNRIYLDIERRLEQMGFEKETRRFTPHITLKRIKETPNIHFQNKIYKYKEHHFGKMKGFKVDLIESVVSPSGPEYCIVE